MRLFVAINLPSQLKEELKKAQASFAKQLHPNAVAWIRPEQTHITLNFLGNVESEMIQLLVNKLRGAAARLSALPLISAGIGVFPERRQPRIIWAGVGGPGTELLTLQQATTQAVREVCRLPDEKEFSGHITIGRCKMLTPAEQRQVTELASSMEQHVFGSWTALTVELMRSELSSSGAAHTVLESIELGKTDMAR